jgi:hypothetical protein
MINLAATESLELVTSATCTVHYAVSYQHHTATAAMVRKGGAGAVTTATDTTILAAPAASEQYAVEELSVRNAGTASCDVTILKDVAATEYALTPVTTLQAGESLCYSSGRGWYTLDVSGRTKTADSSSAGLSGRTLSFYKIGITAEAAGEGYSWALNSGFPGAWSPGTDGVNGRVTDGNGPSADDAGALPYTNAASGANYLTGFTASSSVANSISLHDVLWTNDALDVTVTTEQAIVTPAFPARDLTGTVNGVGVNVGILVTGATGQGGALTDITLNYTNSAGTAAQTATMAAFPATATAGTVVWFQLAAGDVGVKSIEGITIGTTMTSGTISLIAARKLATIGNGLANVAGKAPIDPNTGIRLYNGTCLLLIGRVSATTATTIEGDVTISNR